jgi:hypothetical protein
MTEDPSGNWQNLKVRFLRDLQDKDHNVLQSRDAPHAHPASAIDGLSPANAVIPLIASGTGAITGSGTLDFGTTENIPIAGFINQATGEVFSQCRMPAGRLSRLRAYVGPNTINTGTITVTVRKNGENTALTTSIAAGATGEIIDDVHNVTLAINDLINYQVVVPGASGTVYISIYQVDFIPS